MLQLWNKHSACVSVSEYIFNEDNRLTEIAIKHTATDTTGENELEILVVGFWGGGEHCRRGITRRNYEKRTAENLIINTNILVA